MQDASDGEPNADARLLRIGTVVIDLRYSRLTRDGREIALPPRAFDLFVLFLTRPGVLLARDDIFRRVWKEVLVEDANLTQTVWLLRRALGDEGKTWIRTVSKRGYVFEGPPIEVLGAAADENPVVEAAPPVAGRDVTPGASADAVRTEAESAPSVARPRIRRRIAIVALVATAAAAALIGRWWFASRAEGAQTPARLVVVEAVADGNDGAPRAAIVLASEWIAWQLGDLHLRDVARVAAGADIGAARANDDVLLLSARLDDASQRLVLDAQRVGRGGDEHWQVAGGADDLPRLVDALARQVIAAVAPDRNEAAVAFALPLDAVRPYARALDARRGGAMALADLEETVRRAPRFEPARLQLARRLVELGQIAPAREHVAALSTWIAGMPYLARRLLGAQRAEVLQNFDVAAYDYSALARAYPHQVRFRIDAARNLLADDRADEALRMLDEASGETPPALLQAQSLLLRADAQLALGDAHAARTSALRAGAMAGRCEALHARAQMIAVLAGAQASGGAPDADALRRAARRFESAGDAFGALRANVAAASLAPDGANARRQLDTLLAKARAVGNVALEVQALLDRALLAANGGDFPAYRESLAEAEHAARIGGNVVQQRGVEARVLYDEVQRGDYAAARRRIERWRGDALRGSAGVDLGINIARFEAHIGEFAAALRTLGAIGLRDRTAANAPSATTAGLACVDADILMRQGALEHARSRFAVCAASPRPVESSVGQLGLAAVAMVSGDREGARARMTMPKVADDTPSNPNWHVLQTTYRAQLLLWLGDVDDARRVVDRGLAYAERSGFRRLEGAARLQQTQILLFERRYREAAAELERARTAIPADDWSDNATARLLGASIALASGDETAAWPVLAALNVEAHERGDVLVQLEAMSLARDRLDAIGSSRAAYDALIAQSGMRGASRRWLVDGTAR
ncbi:winged helix-turn-helix domain-containing protein [Tahibacter soli]|uniref:Transcriptional regulator n=1 Tax=Tahibacter soli TaxID=2983605 RepID=A0A9X3YK23_9GAMM|nr:transcriptional regulator [Tahibacter soli]MDC8013039.1 transcriptional regulator [Tahibacter soli]